MGDLSEEEARKENDAMAEEHKPDPKREHEHIESCFVTGEWWEAALACGFEL